MGYEFCEICKMELDRDSDNQCDTCCKWYCTPHGKKHECEDNKWLFRDDEIYELCTTNCNRCGSRALCEEAYEMILDLKIEAKSMATRLYDLATRLHKLTEGK